LLAQRVDALPTRSAVYLWPLDQRKKNANGKPGTLHVKCAAADGRRLFLSSANLTEYAFTLNMELGVPISGGELPGQVETPFVRLIEAGVLATPLRSVLKDNCGQLEYPAQMVWT
jgi:phosphatidylserine/phosphatidylglycerophosphate/cardiolipin synthase-like enzyme